MSNILLNEIEMKGWKAEQLAKDIEMSKGMFSKIVNQTSTPELQNVLKVVRHVIPHKEKEYMEEYLLTLKSPDRIIEGVEYASTNRMFPEFKQLLEQMQNGGTKLKKYAEIYDTVYNFQNHLYSSEEFRQAIKTLNSKKRDEYENVLIDLLESYLYYGLNQYETVKFILKENHELLLSMENSYFIESLKVRSSQLLCHITLIVDVKSENCRKYCEVLKNTQVGSTYRAYGVFMAGLSYLFDNYEKSYNLLNEAARMYKSYGLFNNLKACNNKLEVLGAYWGKESSDISQYENEKDHGDRQFVYGKVGYDEDALLNALDLFDKRNDNFMKKITIKALQGFGSKYKFLELVS